MSIDTAIGQSEPAIPGESTADQQPAPDGPNATVLAAITSHHAQLAAQLAALTDAVLTTPAGEQRHARDELLDWYRKELLPHAVAEEQALYSLAADRETTRLLICGMLAEHRSLVRLIIALGTATEGIQVSATAAAAQAVFDVHVSKENDLLLPALDQAGVDLAVAVDGMHPILGGPVAEGQEGGAGCGCGCSHDDAGTERSSGTLQIVAAPADPADLDVRALPHGQRHEIIFARLDQLEPGQSLVIVNDHDPKPLRYQTEALWPDRFEWSYEQAGPDIWRVAISRAH
jgi:uncharacterized protein (DUF2249 family)